MPVPPDALRSLLGHRAAPVAILGTRAGGRVHGMTVTAFCEVSLEPPLVLVCADRVSNTQAMIEASRVFSLSLLGDGQAELARRFASKADEERRFEGGEWATAETGAPLLADGVGALDCRVVAAHPAGDHVIYVGRVEALRLSEGREVLLYGRGSYGSFRPQGP